MEPSNNPFLTSSPLAKTGSALFAGGGLVGIFYAFSHNIAVVGILVVGILLVIGLLLGYRKLLVLMRKRKAEPMMRGILGNSAVSPHAINEPGRRAKLDDLRKSFENGLEKFRAAGKDVYTLPWYVIVGEPAAGKTEAIRRCNVGFPPGLQEYTQGAGGTLNMNWWFTNHAIILDTAGRMMFEEVQPGSSSEWKEFLRLLAQNRPNCPINGMLLVIPADSLIKDSADDIERKAAKIAQQLDTIQRTLGVRFPVFVIVTKCDLINGFREFFDNLTNPQLQHQMLGWSNPASLDAPFNPELLDQHLDTVRRRLVRRRYTLLLDPVHTEDPNLRRIDQVDSLYTFPDSFMKIAPRLRRYLEMIFVAGEWSPKPLFLRGIYFTSAMREGAALDKELADILGVPVESLPEGRVWERERAYFLRDLFVKKVFQEKGLVTRADKTRKLQRRRKLMVLGASFAAVFILLGLTWYQAAEFRRSIGGHAAFWASVAGNYRNWPLVEGGPAYSPTANNYGGSRSIDLPDTPTVGKLLADVPGKVSEPIRVPALFRPVAALDAGELDGLRRQAYGAVHRIAALSPAIEASRARFKAAKTDGAEPAWNERASDALVELVQLESEAALAKASEPMPEDRFALDPLLRYTLTDRGFEAYQSDRKSARTEPLDFLQQDGRTTWPPEGLIDTPISKGAVRDGVRKFDDYWKNRVNGETPRFAAIAALQTAVGQFREEESRIRQTLSQPVVTTAQYENFKSAWDNHRARLDGAAEAIARSISEVQKLPGGWPTEATVAALFEAEVGKVNAEAKAAYARLTDAAKPLTWLRLPSPPLRQIDSSVVQQLAELDAYLGTVPGLDGQPVRRYALYQALYADAAAAVANAASQLLPEAPDALVQALAPLAAAQPVAETIQRLASAPEEHGRGVAESCTASRHISERARLYRVVAALLPETDPTAEAIASAVGSAVGSSQNHKPLTAPTQIPLTKLAAGVTLRPEFHPGAARALLGGWEAPRPLLASESANPGPRVLNREALQTRFNAAQRGAGEYLRQYVQYWSAEVPGLLALQPPTNETWSTFFDAKPAWDPGAINDELETLFGMVKEALEAVASLGAATSSGAAEGLTNTESNLAKLHQPRFREDCGRMLLTWRQRPQAIEARQAILAEEPVGFLARYTVNDGSPLAAVGYWNALAERRLALLNSAWSATVEADFNQKIRPFCIFPLDVDRGGRTGLTPAEFDRAAAAIRAFAAAGQTTGRSNTIGGGTPLPDMVCRDELEKLRKPFRADWLAQVNKVIDVFSSQDNKATLYLLNRARRDQRLQRAVPPDEDWSDAVLKERGVEQRRERIKDPLASDLLIGTIPLRATQPWSLEFTRAPNGPIVESKQLPAHWPAAELLLATALRAEQVPNDPKKWEIEIPLGSGNQRRSLWLVLEFPGELPSRGEWPNVRKK